MTRVTFELTKQDWKTFYDKARDHGYKKKRLRKKKAKQLIMNVVKKYVEGSIRHRVKLETSND